MRAVAAVHRVPRRRPRPRRARPAQGEESRPLFLVPRSGAESPPPASTEQIADAFRTGVSLGFLAGRLYVGYVKDGLGRDEAMRMALDIAGRDLAG